MIQTTLFENLYEGIVNSNKFKYVGIIFMINIVNALTTGYITALNFDLMNGIGNNNKDIVLKVLFKIAFLNCLNQILSYFYVTIYQKEIIVELSCYFKERFMNLLLLQSNHDWLNCNKSSEIITSVTKGTNALISTLRFLVDALNPILQALGSIIVVGSYIGWKTCYCVAIMTLVFYKGTTILINEFNDRSIVNKEVNPLISYNIHLASTFLISLLNGKGDVTKNIMLENCTKSDKLHSDITMNTRKSYKILEIISLVTILYCIYLISEEENVSNLIAINIGLTSAVDKMWWLFFMVNNVSTSAAEWSALENYLESVVLEEHHYKQKLFKYDISEFEQFDIENQNNEYQITGDSGCGKSTWMKTEVIRLFRKYNVDWIYLDQRMMIPKSSCFTIFDFLTKNLNKTFYETQFLENEIFKWADFLKIGNIINKSTINQSFESPSGGEEKRIIILQKVLPILFEQSDIKVIFADEITAGLDNNNHLIVRSLIEKLKNEFGIVIVNIDHHDYESKDFSKIGVVKTEPYKMYFDKTNEISKSQNWLSDFIDFLSKRYKKEKNTVVIKYPPNIKLSM